MIVLENLRKEYVMDGRHKIVADDINAVFPTGKAVAVLGRNGAGKTTLLRMIAGRIAPDSGRIVSTGSISFPVGFAGSFHAELTGAQNVRFVARIYGVDTDAMIDFVADFAALGVHFNLPVRTYSSGMRSRLAFGVSMAIAFDTYLIDEVTAAGDVAFKDKSRLLFRDRMQRSGAVMVTHSMALVRDLCDAVAVLEHGKLHYYESVPDGIAHHEESMRAAVRAGTA
jgi:capsular polysaccharide transport system ATP-binding protein